MPKFYTCRTVVNPLSNAPAFRLCLKPTVDGMRCAAHAMAEPAEMYPREKLEPALSGTGANPAESSAAVPVESKPEEPKPSAPFWCLKDDGSRFTSADYGHATP